MPMTIDQYKVARLLSDSKSSFRSIAAYWHVCGRMADRFAHDNANFNRAAFMDLCGC